MKLKKFVVFLILIYGMIYGKEIKVGDVIFIVDGKEKNDLSDFVPLKRGDYFDYNRLREGMENLYRTDEFSSIEVEALKEKDFLRIIFMLQKRSIVGKIIFEGETGISKGKLRGGISSLKEERSFNQRDIEKAKEEILSKLEENGFLDAEVNAFTKNSRGEKDVVFNIKSGQRRKIKEVLFSDSLKPKLKELQQFLSSKEGEPLKPFKIKRDVEIMLSYLKKKGYLRSKISFSIKKIDKEWAILVFTGSLGEKIEIEFRGGKVPVEILFPLWEGETLEEWVLEESKIKVQNYLRSKGFLFAEVGAEAKKEGNELKIIFDIKKGSRYRLHRLKFEAEKENINELKKFLENYTESTFSFWANGELIDTYENGIKAFYRNKGYSEIEVKREIFSRRSSVDVLFKIKVGEPILVKSIDFEGGEPFEKNDLKSIAGISEGALYSDFLIENGKERIRVFFMNQGFKNADVSVEINGKVERNIIFRIKKGKRFKIIKIHITGLTKTKEFTVKNMLRIKEGDFYSYEKIQATLKNFQEAGIFSEIKLREIEMDDKLIIIFLLSERSGYHLGIGGGYIERSGPRGSLELSHNNILGLALSGSSVIQFSPKEKRGVISLTNKSFMGLNLENITSLWWEEEERKSFSYDRRGFAISSVDRRNEYSLLLFRYRIARTNLLSLSVKESTIDREYQPFYTSSFSVSYLVDLRDDPFNPTRGRYWVLNLEKAFPSFGTESNFWKFSFTLQHIKSFPYDIIQNSSFRIGYIYGEASITDRFFAGGSSFRGEKVDELGPKDPETGNPIGGNIIFLANIESLLPVFPWENLRLSLFLDFGNVFWKGGNFKLSNFNVGSGIGLWYRTPLGPFKIYLGYNFTKPSLKRKGVILFNIGNEF